MIDNKISVKDFKKVTLKRFRRTISDNLKLLAMSRDLKLYELHDRIISETLQTGDIKFTQPGKDDTYLYNVFIGPEAQLITSSLAATLKKPESDIIYSALVAYADKLKLNESFNAESQN